jgi:hypothetical protein
LTLTACNRAADARPGQVPDEGGAWQVRPHAFPASDEWRSGPTILLPDPAGCFIALGAANDGYGLRTGYWQATGDCTQPRQAGPSRRPLTDGLPSPDEGTIPAAVRLPDGQVLLASRHTFHGDAYAYDTALLRGNATDGFQEVARFETATPRESHIGPHGLAVASGRVVAIGQKDGVATVWTAGLDAKHWSESPVPLAADASFSGVAAGPDGNVVIFGSRAPGVMYTWVSKDAGRSWRAWPMFPSEPGRSYHLYHLVATGSEYVALGSDTGDIHSPAVVLTSPDGIAWTPDDRPKAAGMKHVSAATALPDGSLLVTAYAGTAHAKTLDDECAMAWRYAAGRWSVGENLGCHGAPDAVVAMRDGRIAAAHGTSLFVRTALPWRS